MTNEEKAKLIRPWIDHAERVTVHFRDMQDVIAEVAECSDELVDLSIQTHVPHMKQTISFPLSRVELSEDLAHYTRDPDRPLKHRRLMMLIDDNRPPIIY